MDADAPHGPTFFMPPVDGAYMRAVRLHEHGGTDVLQVDEIERPDPGGHELLVEVAAAGVNPVDTYFRDGSYEPVGRPFTPGVDVAGTVAAVGDHVEGFAAGDRVLGTGIGNGAHQGAYAEYATIPEDRVVHLPADADLVEAGAAGVVAGTAWRSLVDHADLDPAEDCLIHGGAGGVGHAAVQIAAAVHARVITTAAPAYHDTLRDLGADTVLDYGRDDLREAVREASDGGVDVVLDHRLHEYLQFDADVANVGCRVLGIGENDTGVGFERSSATRRKDLQLTMMTMFNTPDFRIPLRKVAYLLGAGDLEVSIAETYGLEDAADAHRDVLGESFLGKLVVNP